MVATVPLLLGATSPKRWQPAEPVILEIIDQGREADIKLLEKMVNINSGTFNLAGVRSVGQLLAPQFEALGFKVRWVNQDAVKRGGHLIAERIGKQTGHRLLLIGHIDTVFDVDSSFQRFVRQGDMATGPGVNDMKGGIVVMLAALRALDATGDLDRATIRVVLSGDEEYTGEPFSLSRADMRSAAKQSDVALEFEFLTRINGRDYGAVSRRGNETWTLTTRARTGHSMSIFADGIGAGAANEQARVIEGFRRVLSEPGLSYNIGIAAAGLTVTTDAHGHQVSGQGRTNIIPSEGIAYGDLRTVSAAQAARMRAEMVRIAEASLPGTSSTLRFNPGYPSMAATPGNRALLALLNRINADYGFADMPEAPPTVRGAGDIAFVSDLVDGLVGVGAAGDGAHTENETIDLNSIPLQAKRAAILMRRLINTRPAK